jgi:hypothetical protein
MEITWEAPTERAKPGPKGQYDEFAAQLRANPGRWAKIGEAPTSLARNIKAGSGAFSPEGAFEAVTRNADKSGNRADIYARFVGALDDEGGKE